MLPRIGIAGRSEVLRLICGCELSSTSSGIRIYKTQASLLPPANEVWGKVIFLHLFVILFTGDVPGPGGCLVPGGGAWSGGLMVPGGCLVLGVPGPGGCEPAPGGVPGGDPPGRLLLRAVRILLECILVSRYIHVCKSAYEITYRK